MDLESAQNNVVAKLPLLKQGDYEMWKLRIEQYFQVQDYAIWDVIENGNSFNPVPRITANADGTSTSTISGLVTTEEKAQKKNNVKARSMLLMDLLNEHLLTFSQYKDAKTLLEAIQVRFSGNDATKKTQNTLLKQMYENFNAPSTESLDSIFSRLHKIVSQLAILDENISQEDLNMKFLRSLPAEWNTHVVVWRNKLDLETMSFDDLYNNFKIVEQEVKRTVFLSSSSGSPNMAFLSSPSSTNEVDTASIQVSAASTPVSTISSPNNTANLKQIHEDDLEEMDLKWQLALLSMRARKYFQRTCKKITINGSYTAGYDKTKVECFNCHKMGHFAKECRSPRSQESRPRNQESSRKTVIVEDTSSKAMVAIDGAGFDWSYMGDDEVPTNMALMAFSDSEVASVEEQLVFYKKNEVVFCDQIIVLKRDASFRESDIIALNLQLEKLKKEKESNQIKIDNFKNSSKSLDKLIESQITDNSKTGLGFTSYNAVAPPPIGLFAPPTIDMSSFGLEEFKQPKFKSYGPKASKSDCVDTSNVIKKVFDAPIIEDWISDCDDDETDEVGDPQAALSDTRIIDSGCSQHMTGNKSFLSDYQEYDGGFIAFVGSSKGGKITGKGKIRTVKLDFEDVYFLKELKFNLFSVSQMCDNKNSFLFIETECLILFLDFKLPDENQVLLKNRVLVTKPHNKTPHELLIGRSPIMSFMGPFGYPVNILNTLDHLGKFDGKVDEGFTDRPIFLNDNEDHHVQNRESPENSSEENVVSKTNQEPPQDSNMHQLIEECSVEVPEQQKQNMENTMFDLVKICHHKQFLCIHDDVDDLIESALNSKLLSINSQRLDEKEQEVKIVEEQPAKCRNHIEKSLQNFRVIHKSSISLNTSQISSIHSVTPILSTKEPDNSLNMGECEVTSEDKRECDELICDNQSDTFSDSKIDDDILVYDNDFEDIEYVEASLLDSEIVSIEEENGVEEENVVQREEEEDNPSISRPPLEPPDDNFDLEPEVISVVMEDIDEPDEHFNPGGEINVSTKIEDDDYFPFMFVIRFFLPYFIFLEISSLLLSAESEDTIFDPGLSPGD
nr:hypothetical protein [Tanacetum cinerariifolium]